VRVQYLSINVALSPELFELSKLSILDEISFNYFPLKFQSVISKELDREVMYQDYKCLILKIPIK
jgi:hypothetical protein